MDGSPVEESGTATSTSAGGEAGAPEPDAAAGTPAIEQPAAVVVDGPPSPTPSGPVAATPPVLEVRDLDWQAIRKAVDPAPIRARIQATVERMEGLLDAAGGPGMLFDADRAQPDDRAIRVSATDDGSPLWIIGDLHGDLLALEAALAQIRRQAPTGDTPPARIVFLGDFIDDEGLALEVLLRVFELIAEAPQRVCVIAGNHDEALSYDGTRFASSVSPSDFADFLNANLGDEWIVRAGKLALRLTAHVPRALFFPDGLLVSHGGFPLADLHPALADKGDWNDPACLADFVWARAHPKARKKMPNRFSRGSQFGYEDFADFCALTARLGRPITHMVRGHDHVEERYAIYPAYRAHPVLTTVALSRRLNRERFGPYVCVPTLARVVAGSLPQVHRLFPPADLVTEVFPPPVSGDEAGAEPSGSAPT
ncbi:MAG: metallophosphoesterase [Polyangiaceae bacterium]